MHTKLSRRIVGAALTAAGVAMAGGALSTGLAGAVPADGPHTWCPGDPPVATGNIRTDPVVWDDTICHEYWYVDQGQGNVAQNIWDGPSPPDAPPTMPFQPPPPLPPGLCWPTGALIPVSIPC